MKVSDFINNEFKGYVHYDNTRNIPNLMDGQKTTQRKILFAFIEDIGNQSIVCDKAGMRCADISYYHHGATSMIETLINMNKDYVGTNNMPLFTKKGQFGTRMKHEASSERYISTRLSGVFNKLFEADDNYILEYQYDRGYKIEPVTYIPKLPLILINGSNGTGNGYASNIFSYEINDIKQAVQEVLQTGLVQNKLTPYFEGYQGDIVKDHVSGQVTYTGVIERVSSTKLIISELPPSMELAKYKDILNDLMETTKNKKDDSTIPAFIKDYDNESTEESWRFIIDCPRSTTALTDEELLLKFKLIEKDTETIVTWLPNGKIKRFSNIEDLITTWVELRLEYYEKRRLNKISRYDVDLEWLKVKMNFISWWNNNSMSLISLKKNDLKERIVNDVTNKEDFINRLLSIQIRNLGLEEVNELDKEINKIELARKKMIAISKSTMMYKEVMDINF